MGSVAGLPVDCDSDAQQSCLWRKTNGFGGGRGEGVGCGVGSQESREALVSVTRGGGDSASGSLRPVTAKGTSAALGGLFFSSSLSLTSILT